MSFVECRFCYTVLQSDAQSQLILSELQALFALLLHSRREAISPAKLLAVTRPPGFEPGFQQDSSEFLTYVQKSFVSILDHPIPEGYIYRDLSLQVGGGLEYLDCSPAKS
jgi:hypothetical protein